MANTRKSVKKVSKVIVVKKDACTCGCDCCNAGDSVKYTSIWAAWRAFWRRGFTEWAGTSSRSEYWLSWIGNLIVFVLGGLLLVLMTVLETAVFGNPGFLTWLMGLALSVYAIAWIIPVISLMTRRMHDAGLSAWLWVIYVLGISPAVWSDAWVYAPGIGLIIALLPTQIHGNRFHKYNK